MPPLFPFKLFNAMIGFLFVQVVNNGGLAEAASNTRDGLSIVTPETDTRITSILEYRGGLG
jgi:hypothetical protein